MLTTVEQTRETCGLSADEESRPRKNMAVMYIGSLYSERPQQNKGIVNLHKAAQLSYLGVGEKRFRRQGCEDEK
jgi:hypothetical protein